MMSFLSFFTHLMKIPVLLCFLDALAENNRLKLSNNVVKAFSKLMSASRGEVLCTVTSAKVQLYHVIGLAKEQPMFSRW